jgi:MFS family permease
MDPMKLMFAMEYVMQGLANPFQGITYQSFFKHFRFDFGLSEAATQQMFSRSYLAWSFKPLIGFLMDALGKTRAVLLCLTLSGALFYLLAPLLDSSAKMFFWTMFALSIVFAGTDVAVDRATVVAGAEESKSTKKSKAATVGLNQAICWAAIYGTSIVSSSFGGKVADTMSTRLVLVCLAAVPLLLFVVVMAIPRDRARPIPLGESVRNFWNGLNTGPILWIVLFYFLFHFAPAMGALWTNYLIETIKFTQTQIGYADGVANVGMFLGVLLFAWVGIKWQDRYGLKNVFRAFIIAGILLSLSSYALIEPWFSRITEAIHRMLPGTDLAHVRWGYYAIFNFLISILSSFTRMSTFSLVGAVIPVNAAGSLFAGFMSVANIAYSFSYSSGAWLYENGLNYGMCRNIQQSCFGIPAAAGDKMSFALLILIGTISSLLCLAAVHRLPDKRHTAAAGDEDDYMIGPEHFKALGDRRLRLINWIALVVGIVFVAGSRYGWDLDLTAAVVIGFFLATFGRKLYLDHLYKIHRASAG